MEQHRAPVQLERHEGNPVLSPNEAHDWESLVTSNPAAWINPDNGKVMMLYRAAGNDPQHVVRFGLAESDNGLDFHRVSDEPVFSPSVDGFDAGCVEDPRVVIIDSWYVITYAVRPFHPGQYWIVGDPDKWKRPEVPEWFPRSMRENLTLTGLAMTQDWKTFHRAGYLTDPTLDDRDVILFPEKIGGKFWMMHRPMEWTGEEYGTRFPAIWLQSSDDLLKWDYDSTLLAAPRFDWERKVGGNTPPIRTRAGWLTLYHACGPPGGLYRLGALLLDPEDPTKVLHRSEGWLLQPEEDYETGGCYDGGGVVFPCGKIVKDGTLHVYYGAADRYVGVATCDLDELLQYLESCPEG